GNYTVIYRVSGPGTEYGSLEDGNYSLKFNEGAIQGGGPGGPGLSSAGDPFAVTPSTFFRLFGDTNGDMKTTNIDLALMQPAVGAPTASPNYRSYLDFTNRGVITSVDYAQFMRRYGFMLTPAGAMMSVPTSP